jgi:proteasome alpha subunit
LGSVADNGNARTITAESLEVAVLDRNRGTRKFRRLLGPALTSLLADSTITPNLEAASTESATPGAPDPESADPGTADARGDDEAGEQGPT